MRERKCVKFRVDMYNDTKFKIIDMNAKRDLIHYVWTRFVTLAGKVNLEGELYLSKNIPFTIETLAIEFNRGIEEVKLALDILIELEMIEFTESKVYKVKNFVKHQNIKVKEKVKAEAKDVAVKNQVEVVQISGKLEDEAQEVPGVHGVHGVPEVPDENNQPQNKINENEAEDIINNQGNELEVIYKDINKTEDNTSNENTYTKAEKNTSKEKECLPDNIPMFLTPHKKKKSNKSKKKGNSIDFIDEEIDNDQIFCFSDGERPLGEGERVVNEWSYCV